MIQNEPDEFQSNLSNQPTHGLQSFGPKRQRTQINASSNTADLTQPLWPRVYRCDHLPSMTYTW